MQVGIIKMTDEMSSGMSVKIIGLKLKKESCDVDAELSVVMLCPTTTSKYGEYPDSRRC